VRNLSTFSTRIKIGSTGGANLQVFDTTLNNHHFSHRYYSADVDVANAYNVLLNRCVRRYETNPAEVWNPATIGDLAATKTTIIPAEQKFDASPATKAADFTRVSIWEVGMRAYYTAPVAGGYQGWVCVAPGGIGGSGGVTGNTDGSTGVITNMSSVTWIYPGTWVTVTNGFPTTGPFKVLAVTATTITVDATSDTAEVVETIDNSLPTFAEMPSLRLQASFTWDPPNLVDGAGETSGSITVTDAELGDFVIVAAPYDLQDCIAHAYVQAADTVEIRLQNESGGAIDLASGSWKVRVIKYGNN